MKNKTRCSRCKEPIDRSDCNINWTSFTIKPNLNKGETKNIRGYLCDYCSMAFSAFAENLVDIKPKERK